LLLVQASLGAVEEKVANAAMTLHHGQGAQLKVPQHYKMSTSQLRAVILVVSTTASKDASADSSGPVLKDFFAKEGGGKWEVVETKIVSDDVLAIQRAITNWTDAEHAVNAIVTTGGTGFAVHDSTPEVCEV
jgi:molybdopterin biosynthesis enzyme MoaB